MSFFFFSWSSNLVPFFLPPLVLYVSLSLSVLGRLGLLKLRSFIKGTKIILCLVVLSPHLGQQFLD